MDLNMYFITIYCSIWLFFNRTNLREELHFINRLISNLGLN